MVSKRDTTKFGSTYSTSLEAPYFSTISDVKTLLLKLTRYIFEKSEDLNILFTSNGLSPVKDAIFRFILLLSIPGLTFISTSPKVCAGIIFSFSKISFIFVLVVVPTNPVPLVNPHGLKTSFLYSS